MAGVGGVEDKELQEMKSTIRSLLIARPCPVSFEVLSSDYRAQVGKQLNYRQFGYDTPLQFVSDLGDTVQVCKYSWGFKLRPVPHQDSMHISQMVSKQKKYTADSRIRASVTRYPDLPYQAAMPKQHQPSDPKSDENLSPKTDQTSAAEPSSAASRPSQASAGPSEPVHKIAPETVELGAETGAQPSDSKPSSECHQAERPFSEPAVRPYTSGFRVAQGPMPFQPVPTPPGNWVWPMPPRPPAPPMASPYNRFGLPFWNMPYPDPHYGQQPAYPNAAPYPYPRWFPPNPYHPAHPYPVYPDLSAQRFAPKWYKGDHLFSQHFNQGEPFGDPPTPSNELDGLIENDCSEKEDGDRSLAPVEAHSTAASESEYQRQRHPTEHSDDVSRDGPSPSQDGYSELKAPPSQPQLYDATETGQFESEADDTCAASSSGAKEDDKETRRLNIRDLVPKIRSILKRYPNGVSIADFLKDYEEENHAPLDVEGLGYPTMEHLVFMNPDIFVLEKLLNPNRSTIYDAKPQTRLCPIVNRQWVPSNVQDNLATLTKNYPNGISTDEIMSLYKEKYLTDINPEGLGFGSIIDLLKECSSVCVKKYNDACLVYPKYWIDPHEKSQLPDAAVKPEAPAGPSMEKMKYLWNGHYKEYECDPLFEYKPPEIPEDDTVEVKIVDVQSPHQFWIQFARNINRLNELMWQMNLHYDGEHANYRLPDQFVEPGLAVAILFEGTSQWHRARIESFKEEEVKVFYVDFGTFDFVKRSDLRKLDRRFGREPMCAVKASMYYLRPPAGTKKWPAESCDFLYKNYSEIILYAAICARNIENSKCPSIDVVLYRTQPNGDDEIVNATFIKEKLASFESADDAAPAPFVSELLTFNKSNIDVIEKLLPLWLTTSKSGAHDVDTTMMNLNLCTGRESHIIPINPLKEPCCLRHIVQRFFHANPVRMSELWEVAYLNVEDLLLKHVYAALLPQFDQMGWSTSLDRPISCTMGSTSATNDKKKPTDATNHEKKPTDATKYEIKPTDATKYEIKPTDATNHEKKPTDATNHEKKPTDATKYEIKPTDATKYEIKPTDATKDSGTRVRKESENTHTLNADANPFSPSRLLEENREEQLDVRNGVCRQNRPSYWKQKTETTLNQPDILARGDIHVQAASSTRSNRESISSKAEHPKAKVVVNLVYQNKSVKYTRTKVEGKPLHIIVYEREVWVCLSQLYSLAHVYTEEELCKATDRLTKTLPNLRMLEVTSEHTELRAALDQMDLFAHFAQPIILDNLPLWLVRLDDASRVLNVIDPCLDYEPTVAILVERMQMLQKTSKQHT